MPRRSQLALDALSFFIADVQTGFGPFIAVYLATAGWSESAIGQALSVGTIAAVVSQLPGGAFVDRLRDKRIAAGLSCAVVAFAAVLFAISASTVSILTAEVLHSFGSAMLGPAVAAVGLAVVGRAGLGERLGRNARFAAIGNGAAAAVLGAAGSYIAPRAVFWYRAWPLSPWWQNPRRLRANVGSPGVVHSGRSGTSAAYWQIGGFSASHCAWRCFILATPLSCRSSAPS